MAKTLTVESVLDRARRINQYDQRELAAAILYWLSYEPDEDDPDCISQFQDIALYLGSEKVQEIMDDIDASDTFSEEDALEVAATVAGWQVHAKRVAAAIAELQEV